MIDPFAIYVCWAADEEGDIWSQVENCRAYSDARGHCDPPVYSDLLASGSRSARPGRDAMHTAARQGAFERLLVQGLDRLSADDDELSRLLDSLAAVGVGVYTPDGPCLMPEPLQSGMQHLGTTAVRDVSPLADQIGLCRAWAERLGFQDVRVSVQGVDSLGLVHGWATGVPSTQAELKASSQPSE